MQYDVHQESKMYTTHICGLCKFFGISLYSFFVSVCILHHQNMKQWNNKYRQTVSVINQ